MAFFGSSWNDDVREGSMFGPKMGSWWVHSDSDNRWNNTGRGYGLVSCGGPSEMYSWIKECEKKFGTRPDDLSIGFIKD